MTDLAGIPGRYVASWHDTDPAARRAAIDALWAEECAYYNPETAFTGRDGVEKAVTEAHEAFIEKGFVFSVAQVDVNHAAVRYQWEMRPADGGEPAAIGTHVFTVDGAGRIVADHQFVDLAVVSSD